MKNANTKKRKFFFFKRLLLSTTDISAYATFNREPFSTAIKYLLLLVLLLNIIPFIFFSRKLHVEISEFKSWLANNLPKMWIKDGVLSCEGEQPTKLVYKDITFIIDAEDDIKRIDPEYDACILFNSRKISLRFMETQQQSVLIPEDLSIEINQETLDRYEKRIFFMFIPIAGIFMYIFPLIKKSLEIIFFSILLSTIYSVYCMLKKIPNPGRLKEFFVTGIYGITAPFCLEILIGISGFYFDYIYLLYYGLYSFYLFQVFRTVIIKQPELTKNASVNNQ